MEEVELIYNPYESNLKIKINHNVISEYSQLVQFCDEPFWIWKDKILDILYSELRNDFIINFTGTVFQQNIFEKIANEYSHCIGFIKSNFLVDINLQQRLVDLNKLYRNSSVRFPKLEVNFNILYADRLQNIENILNQLDVGNDFCRINFKIFNINFVENVGKNNIYILDDYRKLQKYLILNDDCPSYFIIIDENSNFEKSISNNYIFLSKIDELIQTIYRIMLTFPLEAILCESVNKLKKSNIDQISLNKIIQIEPLVSIDYEKKVELCKSNPINITYIPDLKMRQKLIFISLDESIATCNGMSIFGHKEGNTTIEVYKFGDKLPCFKMDVLVIKRNRISKLILNEDELILGIGDKFKNEVSYFPKNADNISSIQWKSSDNDIANVLSNGTIIAKKEGKCRLICTAENISASCICLVKPYLKDLILNVDNPFIIKKGDDIKVDILPLPKNAIDAEYTIKSKNTDIVNVVNNIFSARKIGETQLEIKNINGRILKIIDVKVVRKYSRKKKEKGMFTIFGKKGERENG